MTLHFYFFLLDVLVWAVISFLLCNVAFITKINEGKLSNLTKLSIIFITICSGLLSVFVFNGFAESGPSINSFVYALIVSYSLVIYKQYKSKEQYLPKISIKMD